MSEDSQFPTSVPADYPPFNFISFTSGFSEVVSPLIHLSMKTSAGECLFYCSLAVVVCFPVAVVKYSEKKQLGEKIFGL